MAENKLRILKQIVRVGSVLLGLPGILLGFGFICGGITSVFLGERLRVEEGLLMFILLLISFGGGWMIVLHLSQSLNGTPSPAVKLRSIWALLGIFGLILFIGSTVVDGRSSGFLFPPVLAVAATLPPMAAIAWFSNQQTQDLSQRRAIIAFIGGATLGVFVAIILEILLPGIVLILVFNLAEAVLEQFEGLFSALAGRDIAEALTSGGFLYLFIQFAIIAPLAEEFAKPLVILPIASRLSKRQAFLMGSMAGAGFAALENILYAGFGYWFWAGILVIRALGGAIHPLGAGLMGLAWRDLLKGEPNAARNWLTRFGTATGIHALWNGGSLLVITLAGARFFGQLPPEISVLGLSAGGTTLALLIVLGIFALWVGRSTLQKLSIEQTEDGTDTALFSTDFNISDRAVAIWAFACLVAIVPTGIAGLQLLLK